MCTNEQATKRGWVFCCCCCCCYCFKNKRNLHVKLMVLTGSRTKWRDLGGRGDLPPLPPRKAPSLPPLCLHSEDNTTTGIAVKNPGKSVPVGFILDQTGEGLQSVQRSFSVKSQNSLALTSVKEAAIVLCLGAEVGCAVEKDLLLFKDFFFFHANALDCLTRESSLASTCACATVHKSPSASTHRVRKTYSVC